MLFPRPVSDKKHKADIEQIQEQLLGRRGFPRHSIMTQSDMDTYVREARERGKGGA